MRTSRNLFLGLSLLTLLPFAPQASVRESLAEFWNGIAVGYHVMKLAAKPPDTTLIMPVRTLKVGRVYDSWHADRTGGRKHEGQDLFAPRGTPVRSATQGYITRIGENKLGGLTVWVVGAGRRMYYYAHLDGFAPGLKVNSRVDTGTVIGYVGNTGNARGTPPHLHFGVYTLQGATNPLPLLRNPR